MKSKQGKKYRECTNKEFLRIDWIVYNKSLYGSWKY